MATRGDRRLLALGLASLVSGWVHPSLARLSWGPGGIQGSSSSAEGGVLAESSLKMELRMRGAS